MSAPWRNRRRPARRIGGRLARCRCGKDANTALPDPDRLQLPKTTAVSIVMALTSQTLALGYAEAVLASGGSQRALSAS